MRGKIYSEYIQKRIYIFPVWQLYNRVSVQPSEGPSPPDIMMHGVSFPRDRSIILVKIHVNRINLLRLQLLV